MLDTQYNPLQILVKSTDVERTIQSAYSELLGIYPPSNSNNEILKISSKAAPALKVRKQALYQGGGFIDTLTLIPVYTYAFGDFNDDVTFPSCNFTWASRNYYQPRNETFVDYYEEVVDPVKDAIQ